MSPAGRAPRIALLGNVANCLLPVARALHEAGFEADLFVDDHAPRSARPEVADPGLARVAWIRRGPWQAARTVLWPWRSPVVSELRAYDLVVVSGPGPVYAQWTGRPWCWWVSGGDLTVTPFPWAFRRIFRGLRRKLGAYPLALWQRRAAPRASQIWVQPFAPVQEAVRRLGLESPPVTRRYLPLLVDVSDFDSDRPLDPAPELAGIEARLAEADLVVFHPSRILMDPTPANVRSGQWKGNDRLLLAVAELVRRREAGNLLVVLPDFTGSRDLAPAKELVQELGIGAHVLWARPPDPSGFDRPQMRRLYAQSDVVVDEFGVGWFGTVALEGCAMARPVLCYMDDAVMAQLYPEGHPIISAREPGEIAKALLSLRDPDARRAAGAAGRRWVEAHHSPAAAGAAYVDAISATLRELRDEAHR